MNMGSLEELDAQIIEWNARYDCARFALGALVLEAAAMLGDRAAALKHVASLLSTQVTKRTLERYARAAEAFPDWEAVSAQYPMLGFTTFADAATLPDALREPFIELVAQWNLHVQPMQILRSALARFAAQKGTAEAQVVLDAFQNTDSSRYGELLDALELTERRQRLFTFKIPVKDLNVNLDEGALQITLLLDTSALPAAKIAHEALTDALQQNAPSAFEMKLSLGGTAAKKGKQSC